MAFQGIDRLLIQFLEVAEKSSITQAAHALNISQPALTRNIKMLEANLGVKLFERKPSGVSITAYGTFLARRTKFMQLEFNHARSEIEAFKGGRQGELCIGVISAWGLIYIPEIIANFRQEMKEVKIKIVSDLSSNLFERLSEGELDLVCSGLGYPDNPQIIKEPLAPLERVVIASAKHPLAGKKTVYAEDLLDYSWSRLDGDEIANSRLGAYFLAYELPPPRIDVECDSIDMLMSILRQTDVLGTAPKPVADHTIATELVTLPIQGSLWQYESGIAYRREPNPPSALISFLSCIRDYFLNPKSPIISGS